VGELTGHTKRVTDAKFLGHQDLMVTTSADKTSRLWAVDGDAYKCKVSCPHPLELHLRLIVKFAASMALCGFPWMLSFMPYKHNPLLSKSPSGKSCNSNSVTQFSI